MPRCVGKGPDTQPPTGPPTEARHNIPLHFTRPQHGETHLSPSCGHVSWKNCRDRRNRRTLRQPPTPIHSGPNVSHSSARPQTEEAPDNSSRGGPESNQPTVRLQVPPSLSSTDRHLLQGGASANRGSTGTLVGML